jgi:hypothetical protein
VCPDVLLISRNAAYQGNVDAVLLVTAIGAAWLLVATLLALGLGRAVEVARVREEHRPPRTGGLGALVRHPRTIALGRVTVVRFR